MAHLKLSPAQGSIVLKPASSGTVELSSNSVYDPPNIDPKYAPTPSRSAFTGFDIANCSYLSDESDMNALIKATRLILRLARTPPLAVVLDVRNLAERPADANWFWPGDADPDRISDDEIRRFVRERAQSSWHPVSGPLPRGVNAEPC